MQNPRYNPITAQNVVKFVVKVIAANLLHGVVVGNARNITRKNAMQWML
jgi:hypothetical protein